MSKDLWANGSYLFERADLLDNRSMPLHRLIYVSRVARNVRFSDAEEIALAAAAKNAARGITGVLVYSPSHFIQVLEGKRSVVDATFARIQQDPRHHEVRVLDAREVDSPEFGAWAMVARRLGTLKHPDFQTLATEQALQLLRQVQTE